MYNIVLDSEAVSANTQICKSMQKDQGSNRRLFTQSKHKARQEMEPLPHTTGDEKSGYLLFHHFHNKVWFVIKSDNSWRQKKKSNSPCLTLLPLTDQCGTLKYQIQNQRM